MNQSWFEMKEVRQRSLQTSVWIPLRSENYIQEIGEFGHIGYQEEFFGAATLAIPIEKKTQTKDLNWSVAGISFNHFGCVDHGRYIPSDVYEGNDREPLGFHLVLQQRRNSVDHSEWHLHQDFVLTLGLKRENDLWLRSDEGYTEVAKLTRSKDGSPKLLEVRASHLRDYLCARGMGLFVTSYRDRRKVVEDASFISWPNGTLTETNGTDHWRGGVSEIHEGGAAFGSETFVMHVTRPNFDSEQDVPEIPIPSDDHMKVESWVKTERGRKLFLVRGELWRNEWINPATVSPIVRGDKVPAKVFFIVDAAGSQESQETLVKGGRWLWFRPEVVQSLLEYRNSTLSWYSKDTGRVSCSPHSGIDFGVNSVGLVNAYAKDIAYLDEWEQRIWAGYNVSPDGKVSEELLKAQVNAQPADTQAPESFLASGISELNKVADKTFGFPLFRPHAQFNEICSRAHRFRSTDISGLLSLAKDLARLTADSMDGESIQKVVTPPEGVKLRPLKSLENLLATRLTHEKAHELMSPLFGVYELRHADAHLPSEEVVKTLANLHVGSSAPFVVQGYQLLGICVGTLYSILEVLLKWNSDQDK